MPTFLYRAAIRDLRGDAVLPLNQLREQHPDLYERESAKYSYRPATMDNPVHPLGCRWSEVVFLSPVHPAPIFDALRESGRVGPSALAYWTIEADLLDPDRTCILLNDTTRCSVHSPPMTTSRTAARPSPRSPPRPPRRWTDSAISTPPSRCCRGPTSHTSSTAAQSPQTSSVTPTATP